MKNLVIVESPAKAKTIGQFLGKEFDVRSSFGHIRDLSKHKLGVDIQGEHFLPEYEVSEDKHRVVAELKKAVASADKVWLASDEDREGEAIAWHLATVLNLDLAHTQRIVFHEITKTAILKALENPRAINQNLVDAQQARRVLDRLVGFEVSPILWRKLKPGLSAGRVQSVAVRLVVEREREIHAYDAQCFYRVQGVFATSPLLRAEVLQRLPKQEEAEAFIRACVGARFVVRAIQEKELSRNPAAPFTTSTLQQEASRKLGFSTARTMQVAQALYEAGKITYMRTDSVNLSDQALANLKAVIEESYGSNYYTRRQYHTKTKGAQEAHEAIRPVDAHLELVGMEPEAQRLYELIRNRALASQMASARLLRTTVEVGAEGVPHPFVATGEVVQFDGFLRLYLEGDDDENVEEITERLPKLTVGQQVKLKQAVAQERYTQHPPRYSEAALVKKLEDLGIGRPSTYAPTIATIVSRGYVMKDSREAQTRNIWRMVLEGDNIRTEQIAEKYGAERKKLFPSDIGMVVNDYLQERFAELIEYNFTAQVEEEFDQIASGEKNWQKMLYEFYLPFHKSVERAMEDESRPTAEGRYLGVDPVSNEPVVVRLGRFGPLAQIGGNEEGKKPRYASLRSNQLLETISLEEALELFRLPRKVGEFEGQELSVAIGRFGPYVRYGDKFVSLGKDDDPYTIDQERAIALIEAKRAWEAARIVRTFDESDQLKVVKGRWGLCVEFEGKMYRLPKDMDGNAVPFADLLSYAKAEQEKSKESKKSKSPRTKSSTASTAAKTAKTPRKRVAKK